VVSALQNIGAEKLAGGQAVDGDVLVSADDAEAAMAVCALLAQIGLRAWHVGPLANSAAAEAMTSVLIQINRRYKRVQAGIRITGKAQPDAENGAKSAGVSIRPLHRLPLFRDGDDLAGAIAEGVVASGLAPEDGDVIVVAQKVFSKAEGRAVAPEGPETVFLWPIDPDASAARLRASLQNRFGVRLAVIVSDSLGRGSRAGTVGTAIGVAGLKPIRDRRGETDLFGLELEATLVGIADEIAAAASLVIGEAAEGTRAVLVRGAVYEPSEEAAAADLLRPLEQDPFR